MGATGWLIDVDIDVDTDVDIDVDIDAGALLRRDLQESDFPSWPIHVLGPRRWVGCRGTG